MLSIPRALGSLGFLRRSHDCLLPLRDQLPRLLHFYRTRWRPMDTSARLIFTKRVFVTPTRLIAFGVLLLLSWVASAEYAGPSSPATITYYVSNTVASTYGVPPGLNSGNAQSTLDVFRTFANNNLAGDQKFASGLASASDSCTVTPLPVPHPSPSPWYGCMTRMDGTTIVLAMGQQETTCEAPLRARYDGTELVCQSVCADLSDVDVQGYVPITDPAVNVASVCFSLVTRTCEATVADAANFTLNGQLYRLGTWTYTGTTCAESPTPPTITAVLGSPTGSGGSGGDGGTGITDAETKTAIIATKNNTGTDGVLETALKSIKGALSPTISGNGSAIDCDQTFTCTGDAVRCAELYWQREAFCNARPTDSVADAERRTDAENLAGFSDEEVRTALRKGTVNVAAGLDRPRFLSASGCPAPETVVLNFGSVAKTFEVGFSAFCDLAGVISLLLTITASIAAIRIFIGGL